MGPSRFMRFLKYFTFICHAVFVIASLLFALVIVFPGIFQYGILFGIHSALGIFICFNILGNLLACEIVDTSIKPLIKQPDLESMEQPTWHFCQKCSMQVPPRAWHCRWCKICILRRDHHCAFTGCCIGSKNNRYFLLYLFYASIGCLYATVYNSIYIWWLKYETYGNFETTYKLVCPILLLWPLDWDNAFLLTYILNLYFAIITTNCFSDTLKRFQRGATAYEYQKHIFIYDLGSKKRNLETIFGKQICLVWLLPCVKSKLPQHNAEMKEDLETSSTL